MEYWEVLLLGEEECEDAHMFNKYTLVAVNAGGERKKAEVSPRSRSWQQSNEKA